MADVSVGACAAMGRRAEDRSSALEADVPLPSVWQGTDGGRQMGCSASLYWFIWESKHELAAVEQVTFSSSVIIALVLFKDSCPRQRAWGWP